MARNRWKYSTMGLGVLLGAGAVFYLAVIVAPYLTASTNNRPNVLEGVPDQWAVHTWDNGQQEAKYGSSAADCTLDVVKEGGGNVTLHILLACEGAEEGSSHAVHRSDIPGGGQRTFITEPADFEFHHPAPMAAASASTTARTGGKRVWKRSTPGCIAGSRSEARGSLRNSDLEDSR